MPQKALTSKGNKSLPKLRAANRHGKVIKHKKGRLGTPLPTVSYMTSRLLLLRTNHDVAGALTQKPKKDAAKQHFEDQKVCSRKNLLTMKRYSCTFTQRERRP